MTMHTTKHKPNTPPSKRRGRRLARRLAMAVVILLAMVGVGAGALTCYLSPRRLTHIFNTRASEYFYADVHARRVDFTLWSTFPHLCLEIDSLRVVSRTLPTDSASRRQLPLDADFLASMRHLRGSVNVFGLLRDKFELGHVVVSGVRLNLVTLNDSTNNFDIIPTMPDVKFKIPYISADRVELRDLRDITFYSAPRHLTARASLRAASLRRVADHADSYLLSLAGNADADFGSVKVCRKLPFRFAGNLDFRFSPFSLSMSEMNVKLANVSGSVSMAMNFGDTSRLNDFRTEISTFSLMKLLEFLPSEFLPDLSGLHTDLRTGISIRLTAPYDFASGALPSLAATLTVPSSSVSYTLHDGRTYTVRDITMRATLHFDGDNPDDSNCDIERLQGVGEGLALLASGRISDIFSHPTLASKLRIEGDLAKLSVLAPPLRSLAPQGRALLTATASLPLDIEQTAPLASLVLDGDISVAHPLFTLPGGSVIKADRATIALSHRKSSPYLAYTRIERPSYTIDGIEISSPLITASVSARDGRSAYPEKLHIDVSSDRLKAAAHTFAAAVSGAHGYVDIDGEGVAVGGKIAALKGSAHGIGSLSTGPLTIAYAPGSFAAGTTSLSATTGRGLDVDADALMVQTADFRSWRTQSAATRVRVEGTTPVQAQASRLRCNFDMRGNTPRYMKATMSRCSVRTPVYPAPLEITDLDAEAFAGFDSIVLHSLSLRSQMSALSMNGTMVTDHHAATHPMRRGVLNVDIDTLHFNQIAHTLDAGGLLADHHDSDTRPDTVHSPFVTPGDMDLTLHAHADATVYTNLWLTDLKADARMRPGQLSLDTLSLAANFGHAGMALRYDCPRIDALSLQLMANIYDFHLTEFFHSYPKVLAMMPQMDNLHGVFRANAVAQTQVFPTMYLNTSSLIAHVTASATDMYLHQNPFIHRLAHMALIFRDGDIHIPTIHAEARVFDKLLTIYPFDIHLAGYHLQALGRNDFSGNLFYHVAVLHNPLLPIPFGVNIEGMYHDPKMRFTTAPYSVPHSEKINHIDVADRINLVDQARKIGLMLVHHAARAPILTDDPAK